MRRGERRVLQTWIVLILFIIAIALASAILLQNILGVIISLGFITFYLYWFHVRYNQKKKPRYPLVPPEGKSDVYFPRTDIPRPIHADFREIREKKRRLEKLKKMQQKKRKQH